MSKIINVEDIVGTTNKSITVSKFLFSSEIGSGKLMNYWYECTCSCGKVIRRLRKAILAKEVTSCGCLKGQNNKDRARAKRDISDSGLLLHNTLYGKNKNQAKTRNLEFSLPRDYHDFLVTSNCHYCGIEPSNTLKKYWMDGELKYQGIDRKDNGIGYTEENTVACCIICNRGKLTLGYEEYKEYIQRLIRFNTYV